MPTELMRYRFATFTLILTFAIAHPAIAQHSIYSLHPAPKTSFERNGSMQTIISKLSILAIPDQPSAVTWNAIAYLQSQIKNAIGDTLQVRSASSITNWQGGIVIGEANSNTLVQRVLPMALPSGEQLPDSTGGYVLDINGATILLAGHDPSGTFNGVSTLAQLWSVAGNNLTLRSAHVWDYPDYAVRGLWSQHNLLVIGQVTALSGLEDIMAQHKMNSIMQSDFKYSILDIMPSYYFTNVDSLKRHSAATNVEIIPGIDPIGYSEGILYHDPDLAEGFPATASYVITNDTGKLITDPNATIPNSGFENYTGQHFNQWGFYDGDGTFTTVDNTTFHSGAASAKMTNGTGNCRFERGINCKPWHHYVLSVWVKTSNFSASYTQLLAIGVDSTTSRGLTATQFSFPQNSNGWVKYQIAFNSMQFAKANLYVGAWGGFTGTIWFDDFQVQEVGPVNIVRRAGAPLWIRNRTSGKLYKEGVDLDSVVDRVLEAGHGNYPIDHGAPSLHRFTSGALQNGDTIDVSYAHELSTLTDQNGAGQAMVCMSEDTLYSILKDQTQRAESLYHPAKFFMQHDEIRVIGWDSACAKRKITPAQLLIDNVAKCSNLVATAHPNAEVLVWSDMFDSLHNAVNGYYLVNGDLTGDWHNLSNKITIVNWNGGNASASLRFFASYGFSQITSPYYDAGNTIGMRDWRKAQEGVAGVKGMMYTTWQSDFSFLTQLADYAWGIAPYIYHTPLDSTALIALHGASGNIPVRAEILPDAYDPNDRIASATITFIPPHGPIRQLQMSHDTGNSWVGVIAASGPFQYSIAAIDSNGIHRSTPTYTVTNVPSAVANFGTSNPSISVYPNPAWSEATVRTQTSSIGTWSLNLFDLLGRTVLEMHGTSAINGESIKLDLRNVPSGVYRLIYKNSRNVESTQLSIVR